MLGVAALAAALASALAQPGGLVSRPGAALVTRPAAPPVLLVPRDRASRRRTCSAQRSQPGAGERKVLPVACEQPPRSNVTLPNAASGGLSSLLGG
jgi:hypothetical protein